MELLQNKLRPEKLNDVLGQDHLIGKNKVLTNLVKEKRLFNIIFYGNIIYCFMLFWHKLNAF